MISIFKQKETLYTCEICQVRSNQSGAFEFIGKKIKSFLFLLLDIDYHFSPAVAAPTTSTSQGGGNSQAELSWVASYRFTDTVAVSRLNILATLSSTPTSSIKTNQLLLNQTANRRMKQDTKKFILKSLVSVTIKIAKVSCMSGTKSDSA